MKGESFVYKHLYIYRAVMNILYGGGYRQRFEQVSKQIKDLPSNSQILELCFGDIYLADYCRKMNYRWKGLDLNRHFIKQAQSLGYDASYADLSTCDRLPKANVCVIVGSLYHFHPNVFPLLSKMASAAETIIISEPVSNLSTKNGIIGFIAKRSAGVGKGHETFRYTPDSFMKMIRESSVQLNYSIVAVNRYKKDLIVKLTKNGSRRY